MSARILIYIPVRNAAGQIESVLTRIPDDLFQNYETSILIIDNASDDASVSIARAYAEVHPEKLITIRENKVNEGYGGSQIQAYRYALDLDVDLVLMIHGDGQYAPEYAPQFISPILNGEAAAVFGSRMLLKGAAKRGGMPFVKRCMNRFGTALQNRILGTRFSELHSGYRAYSKEALRAIPFEQNTAGYAFDTVMQAQLVVFGKRIKEIPIPTHYGDERKTVVGLVAIHYSLSSLWAVIRAWLARRNLLDAKEYTRR